MIKLINSLKNFFFINYIGGNINNEYLNSSDDYQIIQKYINKINEYKLFINMLKNIQIKNDTILLQIQQYQSNIREIFDNIKSKINDSKNISINKLLKNDIMYNKLNLIIDNDFNNYSENNIIQLEKKIFLDNLYNSFSETLIKIDKTSINGGEIDSGAITIKNKIKELYTNITSNIITESEKNKILNEIKNLEKKINDLDQKEKIDIKINNITNDDMELIKNYFLNCYVILESKIDLNKYKNFIDNYKKNNNINKNEIEIKLDDRLESSLESVSNRTILKA
jgi:hypothetical protein